MPSINSRPLLLVSVRSGLEAAEAIAGGADILDVKEPARGPLGCPDADVLKAVCLAARAHGIPVTTALGEVAEWEEHRSLNVPRGISFAKLGLSGLADRPDWIERWLAVRRRFDSQRIGFGWVAVAYVDEAAAASPPIEAIVTAALETGCAGILLDTFDKSRGRLFDFACQSQLRELADRIQAAGKFLAAAGRLRLNDAARLASCEVDIVGVRSAACTDSDRQSVVRTEQVAACRAAVRPRLAEAAR